MHKVKTKSTSEESIQMAALLEGKPQIDQQIQHYKNLLKINGGLYESLQKRLNKGFTVTKAVIFGFIPIKIKNIFDELDKDRLRAEIQHMENTVFNQKQYFENWMGRLKDYEKVMDETGRECSQNFEDILKKSREINGNIRLDNTLREYDNDTAENGKNSKNDQQIKNELYLYLKQEVNNSQVHRNRKQ